MKFVTLFVAAVLACSISARADPKVCTEDSKILVDGIFNLIEAIEANPWAPGPAVFKGLLADIQKLLVECAHVQIDLNRFDPCVDDFLPVLPAVKKLIQDIRDNKQTEIIIDGTQIALLMTNAITECMKHKNAVAL